MIIDILGPRCAGKSTLMDAVTQRNPDIRYFSLGALTREEIARDTALGRTMGSYISQGSYPQGFLAEVMTDAIDKIKQPKIGIDGLPRSVLEVQDLVQIVTQTRHCCTGIVEITAKSKTLYDRSQRRVYCPKCNLHTIGQTGEICTRCGDVKYIKRDEDDPEKLQHSLTNYFAHKDAIFQKLKDSFPYAATIYVSTDNNCFPQAEKTLLQFINNL